MSLCLSVCLSLCPNSKRKMVRDINLKIGRDTQSGSKKYAVVLQVVTSSITDHFEEIPLLENWLNFQKDARNICHKPSKCYHFTLQNGRQLINDKVIIH